jgi:oxygen-independent coproporphyrinogen-3 oxidase
MQAHSIYLHIPFCHHLCSYCDFNTYAGLDDLIPAYIEALCQEIEFVANSCEQRLPVHTIFFGGGTPSVLPIVGMEGINRLSLGMQSANAEDLQLLDRQHEYDQVAKAVNQVRKAGFDNYNLDLIFGIPRQTPEMWQKSLELGLSLDPDHLSLYALTIEPGTLLGSRVSKGLLPEPDPDVSAMMYEMAAELLNPKGYEQYEISNWAKRDDEQGTLACQHNLQYWRNLPYLGLGAGAHGFAGGQRTSNVLKPTEYIQKLQTFDEGNDQDEFPFPKTPAAAKVTTIERDEEIKETMMMGLRLTEEGITRQDFLARFGTTPESVYDQEIAELIGLGLLEWDQKTNERLRLTPRGRILGNQVFLRFV